MSTRKLGILVAGLVIAFGFAFTLIGSERGSGRAARLGLIGRSVEYVTRKLRRTKTTD